MCWLHRVDFLEEGSFNSTSGTTSLLLQKAGTTAREGQPEAKAAPRGQGAGEPHATGPRPSHGERNRTSCARGKTGLQNKALSSSYPPWKLSGYLWPGDLGHLVTLSCWASASPLYGLLTEVPLALKVPDLRWQGSTTGHTGAPRRTDNRVSLFQGPPTTTSVPAPQFRHSLGQECFPVLWGSAQESLLQEVSFSQN